MRARPVLVLMLCCGALVPAPAQALPTLTPFSAADATAGCSVAQAVKGYEVEPSLAADPTGRVLAAAWQQDRTSGGSGGAAAHGVAVSTDGGHTWGTSVVAGVSTCGGGGASARISDPWVAVGPEGTIYVASLGLDPDGLEVQSSRDGGATWSHVFVADGGDKETMAVDPSTPGRAWVAWNAGGGFSISRTDDAGASWSVPRRFAPVHSGQGFDVHLLPLTGGRLLALDTEGDTGYGDTLELVARTSGDGGRTWSGRRVLAELDPRSLMTRDTKLFRADPPIFSAASAGRHAWVAIQGTNRIVLFHSGNGGATWAHRPVARHRGGTGTPTIALSPDARSVAVTYLSLDRDRKGDRAVTARWRVVRSADAGATFSDTPLTPTFDARRARSGGAIFLGDYTGLTALGDTGTFAAMVVGGSPLAKHGPTDPLYATFGVRSARRTP